MKSKSLIVISFLLLCRVAMFAQAKGVTIVKPGSQQNNKWVLIANTETKLNLDQDVVTINGKNVFKALKFKVSYNPIEVYDLDVVFDNGQHKDIAVRTSFLPGSESRVLDLPGNNRKIRNIVIKYKSRGDLINQRAHVQFWGMR